MQIGSSVARAALVAASLVLAAAPSGAITNFSIVIEGGGQTLNYDQTSSECTEALTGIATCSLAVADLGGAEGFQFGIDVILNPDPEIDATGFVTNLGPDDQSLQQFTMTITLFGTTGGQTSLIEGDWRSGIADSSGTDGGTGSYGTLSTVSGSSFYTALIDNLVQATLFDDPFAQDVLAPGGHSGYVDDDFGIPIPDPGPIVSTSIGVKFDFAMTGGFDTAEITGGFKVKPVPEPTTALLVAIGLLGLARAGRR